MAAPVQARGIEYALRMLAPLAIMLLLFLLSVVAMPFPVIGQIKPAYLLMAIYYWSIYRPTLMPPWVCFLVGLLADVMTNLPLGVNASIFTLVQWLVRDQRKFLMGQPYVVIWFVFAVVAGLSHLLQWGLYGLADMRWSPWPPVAVSAMATFLLFPAITLFFILVHRVLPEGPQKAYP